MVRKMSSNFTEAEIQNLQDKVEILWPSPLMGYKHISAISWRPVLVVEEAGVPCENHRPWTSNL
jgi:hypothetical protein